VRERMPATPTKRRRLWQLGLQAALDGGPGTCHFAITSVCNASLGFCGFAVDRLPMKSRISVTLDEAKLAAEILASNGVHFLIFTGGEFLAHRDLIAMIAYTSRIGMVPMLVTNGSLLTPKRIDALADAGLTSVFISIDATDADTHDRNRGLPGVCARIRDANAHFHLHKIESTASVTMNRLIDDYQKLPAFLESLGFGGLTFSYPLTTLASSYLSHARSRLVEYTSEELHECFEAAKQLKRSILGPESSSFDRRHAAPSAG